MLLYLDIISDDELVSDSFKLNDVDDIMYRVDTQMVADRDDEDGPDVINVISIHQLKEVQYKKKQYMMSIKKYIGAIVEKLTVTNPERVPIFKKKASEFLMKTILPNFAEYQLFSGKDMDPTGMIILAKYEGENITPSLFFWKDGVKEEKF